MNCNCPSEDYVLSIVNNVAICTKTTVVNNVTCPPGCVAVIQEDGNAICDCIGSVEPTITDVTTPVELTSDCFKDVSWTVSYSPILNSWLSFYSYKPNYYINHNTYFQTGINNTSDPSEFGLWSHLLTNKSYQVFYGKKHPFTIEYGIKDEYLTKTFYNVHLWVEARRYQNDYDYSSSLGITFNKAIVYNNVSCSGHLNLRAEPNRIARSKDYPKTNPDNTQDIMITNSDRFKWSYNYFYNRVRYNTSNIPFILRDDNQIEVSANPNIVNFKGKPVLERLTGNWFLNRISYDLDTRYSLIFKFTSSESEI